MAEVRNSSEGRRRKRPPATTPETRENQMIALAYDEAQRQMLEGTASAMVITHFLKAGTAKTQLETEKLRRENILLDAKAEAMESAKRVEELYSKALTAMREYQGMPMEEDEYE